MVRRGNSHDAVNCTVLRTAGLAPGPRSQSAHAVTNQQWRLAGSRMHVLDGLVQNSNVAVNGAEDWLQVYCNKGDLVPRQFWQPTHPHRPVAQETVYQDHPPLAANCVLAKQLVRKAPRAERLPPGKYLRSRNGLPEPGKQKLPVSCARCRVSSIDPGQDSKLKCQHNAMGQQDCEKKSPRNNERVLPGQEQKECGTDNYREYRQPLDAGDHDYGGLP